MDVATALGTYLEIVDSVAPGLVEGLYVVGSYALDDWQPGRSDIDVVAVLAEPATDDDFGALRTAHSLLNERQPHPHIDGPYLAWGDLIAAPATGLHRPWTLDGELHHDGECFEINPVTWYTLATYGVTVRGPGVDKLHIWHETEDRVRFVIDNLSTYWYQLARSVVATFEDPSSSYDRASFEWCALGALRLHYTAFTGDVTSKRGAGEYGIVVTPNYMHDTLRAALDARASGATAERDGAVTTAMMLGAADVISWTVNEVRRAAA
ncbi:MAG: nucleotidyltransferase domain-containing protein [Actinomycetota bacterium]|nr:nucleotidyltransferase domain-containing protein [Actinomycetota bacterium]